MAGTVGLCKGILGIMILASDVQFFDYTISHNPTMRRPACVDAALQQCFWNDLGCVLIQATVAKALVRVQGKARGVPFGPSQTSDEQRRHAAGQALPEGLSLEGASAALRRLPIDVLWAAHRALHPSPSRLNAIRRLNENTP